MERFSVSIERKKSFISHGKSEGSDPERKGYCFDIAAYDENNERIGSISFDHFKNMNVSERIDEVFYVKDIQVVPSRRNEGLGSEMIDAINKYLITRKNALGVLNDGIAKRNVEAALLGFYDRHGWKDIKSDSRFLGLYEKLSGYDLRMKINRISAGNWKYFYQGADIDDEEYERLCRDVIIGTNFFLKKK